jgi:outer membrane protein assembly factor BamB
MMPPENPPISRLPTLWLLAASLLVASLAVAAEPFDRLKSHAAPKPLPAGAKTEDWPRFLGAHDNATSGETKLLHTFPQAGPARVWEVEKGTGFGGPAIAGDHLVFFHRINNKETVDCLHAETGQRFWTFAYDAPYQDRYGSGDGPRSSPVIEGNSLYTYGVSGHLHCLDLATGKERWQHDVKKEFHLASAFFGCGGSPLVKDGRVIMNIGTDDGTCAVAFAAETGKLLWRAKHEWGASYASPIAARLHGRDCILIFAGGESRPATGGLLCLDAKTGELLSASPHRAEIAESVNASSPALSGSRVFVTEAYGSGGEAIDIQPDFKAKPAWRADGFGAYFMTPVVKDGHLYGCVGLQSRLNEFVCYDLATGKENWRDDLGSKFGRASLLAVDGAFLCLGEFGDLAWLDLTPKGAAIQQQTKLFNAPDTWTLPALSRGLLYVCQNQRGARGETPRLICYDLRGTP